MIKYLVPIWLIWGCNWVVMKVALNYFTPPQFVEWRFALGSLVLLAYIVYKKLPMVDLKFVPWIAGSGIFMIAVNNLLIQHAMLELGAGMAAVLNYSMPVWVLIPAHYILKETITPRKIISIILSLSGLCVLLGVSTDISWSALLLAILSAWSWGLGSVVVKAKLTKCPPMQLTCGQMAAGAIFMILVNLGYDTPPVDWNIYSLLCILYNAFLASALCFFLWSYVLQNMEASKAGTAVLVAPAVSVLAGIVFLDESFTMSTVIGLLLVAVGVISAVTAGRK